MKQDQIDFLIKANKGLAETNNKFFDENGYLVVKNLYDPEKLIENNVPGVRGQLNYFDNSLTNVRHIALESQVNGSLSRYAYPPYKSAHTDIKKIIEEKIGKKLYRTYYYDRFYFPGQELEKHVDRDSCEISVSVHIGTNLNKKWEFELYSVNGEHKKISLMPGDGLLYKGCEICHWRSPMPGKLENSVRKFLNLGELYYHQIFFHYVLSEGHRSHHAFDAAL